MLQEFYDNAVGNLFVEWKGMEALGRHCFCPGDNEIKRGGGALDMHDQGFKVTEPLESDEHGTGPHTIQSRVRSTYPQEIVLKKFKTVEQGVAWVA
eukprot:7368398-Prorocentrum_lima.AAC.1